MKKFFATAVLAAAVIVLLSGRTSWAASETISEAEAISRLEAQGYRSPHVISIRGTEVRFEYMDQEAHFLSDTVNLSKFHRSDNIAPEEGGRYWKSPLVARPRDAYSVKRPSGKATVAVAALPASLPKFSKGVNWGIVAVSPSSGRIVRGKITPAGPDKKNGQQPAVVVFEEPVEADSRLLASDRWYDNRLFGRKGELVIWNPATASRKKLVSGMWLERDPAHLALIAQTYGAPLEQVQHTNVSPTEAEQVSKKLGWKKVNSPDGIRYTPVDVPVFKKLYAKPSLVRWHQRFANNGGLAIGIPPQPVGAALNVGVAAITATFDTRHNVPCLSTLKGGLERFERDQRFYETGNALASSSATGGEIAAAQWGAAGLGQAGGMVSSGISSSNQAAGIEDILAQINPTPPTGYCQAYDWPGFWLEPKRAEWPSGGGAFRSPQLRTEYAFSNSYLHLFGGEIASNATLHWGPAHKADFWKYRTDAGYRGHGHFLGIGGSAELVARHRWGGSDSRFALWWGYDQLDRGRYHHDRRHPWMFEWQTELWWRGIPLGKDGKFGSLLSGAKMGTLAKTNDFLLAWLFPVLYRSPYDIAKISAGPQFLHFFSRTGDEPKGGGLGVQGEVLDGLGYRLSYFPFKRGLYHTGWVDPYRVWHKLQELKAEFGIYEIPWDPYIPKATAAASVSPVPPKPTAKEIKPSLPAPERVEKEVKVKKYKIKKAAKKKKVKKSPPKKPTAPDPASPGLFTPNWQECQQEFMVY